MELVEIPEDSESELSIEELIARQTAQFERAKARWKRFGARQVQMPPGPYAIAHFGDPHVDDDGCDWPALMRAIETVNKTEGMYAANGGDSSNRWVGFLQKKYGDQQATRGDEDRLVEWLFCSTDWLYVILGNHDCIVDTAEVLTRSGWRSRTEVDVGDDVFQYNPATGRGEWGPVLAKVERIHRGEMVRFDSDHIRATMTPNHRVFHATPDGWGFAPAETINSSTTLLRAAPDSCGEFDSQLFSYASRHGEFTTPEPTPDNFSCRLAGDFDTLSTIQESATVRGWASRIEPRLGALTETHYLYLEKGSTTELKAGDISRVDYEGVVWCLTVEHGNFMMREGEKPHFTGNCWNSGAALLSSYAKRASIGVIAPDDVKVELLSPDGAPCKIHARHDFKGNSIWNPAHGPMRASKLEGWADVYIAYHRHIWVDHREECDDGVVRWCLRARGFKRFDDYARSKGFPEQQFGEVLTTVHDPAHPHPGERVQVFLDPGEAAEVLKWKRKRRGY